MTTKIKSGVIGDNVVGITQLNVSDGTNGQYLQTDGAGTLSFSTVSETTINNNADNRIITGSGTANTLNGESGLTYDGSTLAVTGAMTAGSSSFSGNLRVQAALSSGKLTVGDFGDTARAASFHGGSILVDGGAATEIIIGDGNVAYMSIQTTDDATAMKIRDFSGSADLVTIERASGNVGIGTDSPRSVSTYKTLAIGGESSGGLIDMVNASSTLLAALYSDATGSLTLNADPNGSFASSTLAFQVDGSERMRINSSGNVGIGTTSPDHQLDISGGGGTLRVTQELDVATAGLNLMGASNQGN